MWMLLPVISLVLVHLSGNNIGLIPDMVTVFGNDRYMTNIITYIILGGSLTTIIAWIGVTSGLDLVGVTKKIYGPRGKKILAISLLSTSIPASALTGGYYAGNVVQLLLGTPYWISTLFCLLVFSLFAVEYHHELLQLSNYIALLLMPILVYIFFSYHFQYVSFTVRWSDINWLLVLGLIAYNVGGMWLAFLVETTAYWAQQGKRGIIIVVVAKIIEGLFTFGVAYAVLLTDIQGPLSIGALVSTQSGVVLATIFYVILLCTFCNAMAPAMIVNARQVSSLIGVSFWPGVFVATAFVYGISFLKFSLILSIMGYTSIIMILFIIYTAYFLHKYGINQQ